MKPHTIAFLIAALATAVFFYQINNINRLTEEAAVWRSNYDQTTSVESVVGVGVRSFFDGLTLGAFSDDGIFTESKRIEREGKQLMAARASLLARHDNAIFIRNAGLIAAIIAGIVGFILKANEPTSVSSYDLDLEDDPQ